MAPYFKFAIIRFAPNDARGERLNVGVVILNKDGVDVRAAGRLDKIKAISAAVDVDALRALFQNLKALDDQARHNGLTTDEERLEFIGKVGPLTISTPGRFIANNHASYEERISALLKMLVEPEPAPRIVREKKTRLFSQLKKAFREERVLARNDEGLDSHRIVPAYELDDGLVADLVLRNGSYHVIETVDASGDEHALKRTIAEIAVSALVLERARMRFGQGKTNSKLVYTASATLERIARPSLDAAEHQGATLVNWSSTDDRNKFIYGLANLATPLHKNKRRIFVSSSKEGLFH